MRKCSICFALVFAIFGSITSIAAQPETELIALPIAAQTHYIRSDFGTDPYLSEITELMTRAIEIFDALWVEQTPVIFIDLVPARDPSPVRGVLPDAVARPTHVEDLDVTLEGISPAAPICEVRITDVEAFPMPELVHEIAHCYQFFNLPFFLEEQPYDLPHAWWVEGSAQWMTTLVTPLAPTTITDRQRLLQEHLGQSLTAHDYDAFYFWTYFSLSRDNEAVIRFLSGVPADPAAHLDYLSTHLGEDVDAWFHEYARQVATSRLPYLPAEFIGAIAEALGGLPATFDLTAEPFGIDILIFQAPIEEDQGLIVEVSGLAHSGLKVSVLTGGGFVELSEGEGIEVCDTAGILPVVWSRTDGGGSGTTAADLRFDLNDQCEPEPGEVYRVPAWRATHTDESGEALVDPETGEPAGTLVAFLEYDDGVIAVWPGADILFTETEEGFAGALLTPDPDITVTSTLQIVDATTRREIRQTSLFGMEQISYITYTLTDETIEIWSESDRNFLETTLLGTCLGRTSVTLSFGWAAPDVLMPIQFADDGTLIMNYHQYVGGVHEEVSVREGVGRVTTTTVRRSVEVGAGSIGFRLHGTIDGRDDCEMIYTSVFTPFDANYDALIGRAQAIGASFAR